jgi:hypothetical protein
MVFFYRFFVISTTTSNLNLQKPNDFHCCNSATELVFLFLFFVFTFLIFIISFSVRIGLLFMAYKGSNAEGATLLAPPWQKRVYEKEAGSSVRHLSLELLDLAGFLSTKPEEGNHGNSSFFLRFAVFFEKSGKTSSC